MFTWTKKALEPKWLRIRHSAGLRARVILDGATCLHRELGDVRDVLECSRCVVGKVGEEEEVLMDAGA